MKINSNLSKYILILILSVLIILLILSYNNYQQTKQIIKNNYRVKQKLVESSVYESIKQANLAYQIVETELNQQMYKYSRVLIEKYRQNSDPESWNLEKLKAQFEDYEIYIINQELTVIKTTYKPDLGLDFRRFPAFQKLLERRMQGEEFTADRMDFSIKAGDIKKFSYMPTPDNRYLLELSINIGQKYPILEELDLLKLTRELTDKYDSVEQISVYKTNQDGQQVGKVIGQEDSPLDKDIQPHKQRLIQQALTTKTTQYFSPENQEKIYHNRYIPFLNYDENKQLDWWNSFIIEITYNRELLSSRLNTRQRQFLLHISIILIIFLGFVLSILYLFRRSQHLANHDYLTTLPNRKFFEEKFRETLKNARNRKQKLAVLFLDLDNFKEINDNYGHKTGDKLLKKIASRMKSTLRQSDIVSRIGGDEFTVLVTNINSYKDSIEVTKKLIKEFKKPFIIDDQEISIMPSIGISLYPEDGYTLESLLQKADSAMYQAKQGENIYQVSSN